MADDSTGLGMFQRFSSMWKRSIYAEGPKTEEPAGDAKKNEKECKPCKICTEQRKAKDKCIKEKGEAKCKDLIKAFDECMKKNGGNGKKDSNGGKNGKNGK